MYTPNLNLNPSHTLSSVSVLSWCLCLCSRSMFVFVLCFGFVLFPSLISHSSSSFLVSAQCDVAGNNGGVPGGTPSNQALVLWVSSTTHTGALGGREGANALCTSMQPASITKNGITSQALLSYSDQNAIEAIPANVDIKNTQGQCIAANSEDLFNGLILSHLLLDENGQSPTFDTTYVFTATTPQGYKAGLGFAPQGDPAEFYKTKDDPDKYCSDFTTTTATTASSLGWLPNTDFASRWISYIQQKDAQGKCDKLNHIYCITSAPAPTQSTTTESTVAQDPQFVGLQGQRFQVHGIPEEYFNLVSHPFFQLNSHFTYLATGICNYNDTACWSHPGTYVDEMGLMLPGYEIGIFAGEHQQGLTVTVNGRTILQKTSSSSSSSSSSSIIDGSFPFNVQFPLRIDNDTINSHHTAWLEPQTTADTSFSSSSSSSDSAPTSSSSSSWLLSSSVSVSFLSRVHVVIDTPIATLDIYNADHFFNFALELRAPRLLLAGAPLDRVPSTHSRHHTSTHAAGTGTGTGGVASAVISPATSPHPTFPMHGLVGQTWKNVKYPHGRLYAGEVDDYILSDRRLFSTNFVYNEYQY